MISLLFVYIFFLNELGVQFIFRLYIAKNLLILRGRQDSFYSSGGHFQWKSAFLPKQSNFLICFLFYLCYISNKLFA